jgi:putative ATPase
LLKDLGYGNEYLYNPTYLYVFKNSQPLFDVSDGGGFGEKNRHPVQQEYLPPHLVGEQFLKKEGDGSDKVWDDILLGRWERESNDGHPWSGRLGATVPDPKSRGEFPNP